MGYLCLHRKVGRQLKDMRDDMTKAEELAKELDKLEQGRSKYVWDEWEEIITDQFEDEAITNEEYDALMKRLMDIDCEL